MTLVQVIRPTAVRRPTALDAPVGKVLDRRVREEFSGSVAVQKSVPQTGLQYYEEGLSTTAVLSRPTT